MTVRHESERAAGASGGEDGGLWDDTRSCLQNYTEKPSGAVTRRKVFVLVSVHQCVVIQVNSRKDLATRPSHLLVIIWQKGRNALTGNTWTEFIDANVALIGDGVIHILMFSPPRNYVIQQFESVIMIIP